MADVGPVALVTGATSGIGLAITRRLGRLGARVYLCARSADAVAKTVEELRAEGLDVDGSSCDVSVPQQIPQLARDRRA